MASDVAAVSRGSPKPATIWFPLASSASPARMVSVTPKTLWVAVLPLRSSALSMTSSWSRVATWNISIAAASA